MSSTSILKFSSGILSLLQKLFVCGSLATILLNVDANFFDHFLIFLSVRWWLYKMYFVNTNNQLFQTQ